MKKKFTKKIREATWSYTLRIWRGKNFKKSKNQIFSSNQGYTFTSYRRFYNLRGKINETFQKSKIYFYAKSKSLFISQNLLANWIYNNQVLGLKNPEYLKKNFAEALQKFLIENRRGPNNCVQQGKSSQIFLRRGYYY